MSAKHTPAPWLMVDDSPFVYALTESTEGFWKDGKPIEVNRFCLSIQNGGKDGAPVDELMANARLIAAAPDMLQALKSVRLVIDVHCGDVALQAEVLPILDEAIEKAEVA